MKKVTRADNRIAICRAATPTQGRCKHDRCKHTWVEHYNFFQNISKLKLNVVSKLANVIFNPPSSNTYFLDCIVVSPSHSVVALNRSFKFNFCSATLFPFSFETEILFLPFFLFLLSFVTCVRLIWDVETYRMCVFLFVFIFVFSFVFYLYFHLHFHLYFYLYFNLYLSPVQLTWDAQA